jgi:hypothetical protein
MKLNQQSNNERRLVQKAVVCEFKSAAITVKKCMPCHINHYRARTGFRLMDFDAGWFSRIKETKSTIT